MVGIHTGHTRKKRSGEERNGEEITASESGRCDGNSGPVGGSRLSCGTGHPSYLKPFFQAADKGYPQFFRVQRSLIIIILIIFRNNLIRTLYVSNIFRRVREKSTKMKTTVSKASSFSSSKGGGGVTILKIFFRKFRQRRGFFGGLCDLRPRK